MKKPLVLSSFVLVSLGLLWVSVQPAGAISAFRKQFEEKYVKPDSDDPKDVALLEAFDEAGCNVCHMGGFRDREFRNGYGESLADLLDKEADKYDDDMPEAQQAEIKARIQAALDSVAKTKSDPDDPDSPTYGEKIAAGKLPDKVVKKLPKAGE
jgi:hypothetical protein